MNDARAPITAARDQPQGKLFHREPDRVPAAVPITEDKQRPGRGGQACCLAKPHGKGLDKWAPELRHGKLRTNNGEECEGIYWLSRVEPFTEISE